MWHNGKPRGRAGLLAATVLVTGLGLVGCAKQNGPPSMPAGTMGSAPSSAPSPSGSPTAPASPAPPVLADGRHPVFVTGLDVAGRTIAFDLIQFLTGDAAKQAWGKEHPEEPDGPPNDYFIVNDNPRLRTLPITATVTVKVVDPSTPSVLVPIALTALPAYFSKEPGGVEGRLWHAPFWLVVTGGAVVSMEEQFLP